MGFYQGGWEFWQKLKAFPDWKMLYTARNGAPTRWKQHFLSLTTKERNDPLCANQPFFYQTSAAASMPCHLDGDTICLPHSHPFWKHVAKVHCSKWQHMFKVRLYILAAKEHPWQSTLQLCPRGVWVLFWVFLYLTTKECLCHVYSDSCPVTKK